MDATLSSAANAATTDLWLALESGGADALFRVRTAIKEGADLSLPRSAVLGLLPSAILEIDHATPMHAVFIYQRAWFGGNRGQTGDGDYKKLLLTLINAKASLSELVAGQSVLLRASSSPSAALNFNIFRKILAGTPQALLGLKDFKPPGAINGGQTALGWLIARGAWQRARALIERGTPLIVAGPDSNNVLFALARQQVRPEHLAKSYAIDSLMALACKRGANLQDTAALGESLLHAVPDILYPQSWFDRGFNPNAVSAAGCPLLMTALRNLRPPVDLLKALLVHPKMDWTFDGPDGFWSQRVRDALDQLARSDLLLSTSLTNAMRAKIQEAHLHRKVPQAGQENAGSRLRL
jgi:hypothetical protein